MGNRQTRRQANRPSEAVEANDKSYLLSLCEPCLTNNGRKNHNSKAPTRTRLTEEALADYRSSIITLETD